MPTASPALPMLRQRQPPHNHTAARRRLWDDNDLLVSASCRDFEDDMNPLVTAGRSLSDSDLSRWVYVKNFGTHVAFSE